MQTRPRNTDFARQLRKSASYVEKIIWNCLRGRRFHELKFRRQQSIGPFIVDFVCFEKRVVLEFDGPHHQNQVMYDSHRDSWLANEGYRVLRIKNESFLGNENLTMKLIEDFIFRK
jgi:very-short-patch-repair endonuclease